MVLFVKTLSADADSDRLKYRKNVVVVLNVETFLAPDFILSHIAFVNISFCCALISFLKSNLVFTVMFSISPFLTPSLALNR